MITQKRVAEWRTIYKATKDAPESRIDIDAFEVIETFEALFKENDRFRTLAKRLAIFTQGRMPVRRCIPSIEKIIQEMLTL